MIVLSINALPVVKMYVFTQNYYCLVVGAANLKFYWIGAQRIDSTSNTDFVWRKGTNVTDSVIPMTYTNFGGDDPNGYPECCIFMDASAQWHDYPCTSTYGIGFVCEYDLA